MKKAMTILLGMWALSQQAQAQSDVTIYGIVDAGITYYSKAASTSRGGAAQLDTGVAQGNRIGFKGAEDLGGGARAFFVMENGFSADTGAIAQGGVFFGRMAMVGLSNALGSVSMGRQYDLMADLAPFSIGFMTPAGLSATGLPVGTAISKTLNSSGASILGSFGSLSNRVWGERVDNSIKYSSPTLGGWTLGALYGFGEVAGTAAAGQSYSLGARYGQGRFKFAAALTSVNNSTATASNRTWGGGASYDFGSIQSYGYLSRASTNAVTGNTAPTQATTFEVGSNYTPSVSWLLGAGYQYQKRNNGFGPAQQFTLVADYLVSKRTDVYTSLVYGKDDAFNAFTTQVVGVTSYDHQQMALRVGMRHKF